MRNDASLSEPDIRAGILEADKVLGLNLGKGDKEADAAIMRLFGTKIELDDLPEQVRKKLDERDKARQEKNWKQADLLRNELESSGYVLEDTADKTIVFKK